MSSLALKDKGALITQEVQVSNKSPFLEANATEQVSESSAASGALFLPSHHKWKIREQNDMYAQVYWLLYILLRERNFIW